MNVMKAAVTPRAGLAEVTPRAGLAELLARGTVRTGRDVGAGGVLAEADLLPVLPALRGLLPDGGLRRGHVVTTGDWGLLSLALAAGAVAAGAWCAVAGVPHAGIAAAADTGLDPARLLLIDDLGQNWPQVVASLLDGCELVVLRSPEEPSAQIRRKLEATVRRHGGVLLVAGEWDGAQVRLRVVASEWTGIGWGHGRLRARRVQVAADGRGGWSRPTTRWLWLPGPDGAVSEANSPEADWPGMDWPRANSDWPGTSSDWPGSGWPEVDSHGTDWREEVTG
jgi:hypothetical protein